MGCASSTPVKESTDAQLSSIKDGGGSGAHHAVKQGAHNAGGSGHNNASGPGSPNGAYTDDPKRALPSNVEAALKGSAKQRGVSFAGDVRDTPTRREKDKDDDSDTPSRAVSISGRPR